MASEKLPSSGTTLRFRIALVAMGLCGLMGLGGSAAGQPYVFIANRLFTDIVIVDVATGDRRTIDLYHYPGIIKNTVLAANSETTVYGATVSALQFTGIHRLDSEFGIATPISGDVLADSQNLLGDGRDFPPGLRSMVISSPDELSVVRAFRSVMGVTVSTGDRRIVSQSDEPAVGDGIPQQTVTAFWTSSKIA